MAIALEWGAVAKRASYLISVENVSRLGSHRVYSTPKFILRAQFRDKQPVYTLVSCYLFLYFIFYFYFPPFSFFPSFSIPSSHQNPTQFQRFGEKVPDSGNTINVSS